MLCAHKQHTEQCTSHRACFECRGHLKKGPPRSPFKSLDLSHDETKTVLVEQVVFTLAGFRSLPPHPMPPPSWPRPHSKQIRSPFRRAVMRGKHSQSDISLAAEDCLCELNSITQLRRRRETSAKRARFRFLFDRECGATSQRTAKVLTCVSPLMCF